MLGTNLIATQERLDQLIARLNNLAAGVEQGKGTAGKLITDPALADEAQKSPGASERSDGRVAETWRRT